MTFGLLLTGLVSSDQLKELSTRISRLGTERAALHKTIEHLNGELNTFGKNLARTEVSARNSVGFRAHVPPSRKNRNRWKNSWTSSHQIPPRARSVHNQMTAEPRLRNHGYCRSYTCSGVRWLSFWSDGCGTSFAEETSGTRIYNGIDHSFIDAI